MEEKSYAYYRRALESGEHIAYLVYDNGKFIGAGGVSFYQVMPTYHNPTGKKAYIMNMYTAPEYRRQGIAINTLDLLVKDAKEQGGISDGRYRTHRRTCCYRTSSKSDSVCACDNNNNT